MLLTPNHHIRTYHYHHQIISSTIAAIRLTNLGVVPFITDVGPRGKNIVDIVH